MPSNIGLDKRNKCLLLNDCVKIITQASWDLKIISQQFPVSEIGKEEYDQYIEAIKDQVVNFSEAVSKMYMILNK